MKRIIKLTESDLTRIVKRVISEEGYKGIKNDLEYESGIYDIADKLLSEILNFNETIKQLKSIIKGSSYEFNKSRVFKQIIRNHIDIAKKMSNLEKLISLFQERDMKLSKSDLGDYGFDIVDLLDDLEKRYNEIDGLRSITTDEDVIDALYDSENILNDIVDLLYEIPD